tara:strand:+ start:53 stop:649 length:597 start_codon:yes stop_codon:yes gene_type:complete
MANVSDVKAKFFEPQGLDADKVSASGSATTLVIADGGPYGNVTETITLYSSANNSGNTFTITGTDGNGDAQTEDVTGPGAGATVNSANKYLTVTSIVSDGAIATDIQAGILGTGALTGTVFAGRTRIRGMTGTSKASAGNVVFKNTSITGTSLLTIPLSGAVEDIDPYIPDNGVLFSAGAYVNLTAASITGLTVFYDG